MDTWTRYSIERLLELMANQGFQYENLPTQQRLYGGSVGVALVILLREALQQGLDAPLFMDLVDKNQVINEISERDFKIPVEQPDVLENLFARLIDKAWKQGAPLDDLLENVFAEVSA